MASHITCSVVIPVYNSELTLAPLMERLAVVLPTIAEAYEVIMVNDGSRDGSWGVIQRLAEQYLFLHGINLMRNYGQHNALLCGIRTAQHDIVVTMDDDLQNPPEEIPKLIAKLEEGYDVVYGAPANLHHGFLRNQASQITKRVLQSAMGVSAASKVSAFRAFRTHLRQAFDNYEAPLVSIEVLLTWGTKSFGHVEVEHHPRTVGKSNYTVMKLITHAVNMITGFSTLPLQLASLAGFAFTLFGFAILVYVMGRYFVLGYSVPGFPFLASTIAVFSGVQLFSLGIIGEYLARLYKRGFNQPAYVARDFTPPIQSIER